MAKPRCTTECAQEFRRLEAEKSALLRAITTGKDETAWLIEFFGQGQPTYYGLSGEGVMLGMTSDHNEAVRFVRKQDAQMVIDDIGWSAGAVQPIEHMWCDGKLHSLAARSALR